MVSNKLPRRVIAGITIGDINGIGAELVLKTFADQRMFNHCIPVVYGSTNVLNYHRKKLNLKQLNYNILEKNASLKTKTLNIVDCIEKNAIVNLGHPSKKSGEYAIQMLDAALRDLHQGQIEVLITGPVDKYYIQQSHGYFTGQTEYITNFFGLEESLMFMVSPVVKIGLVTNHVPLKEVAGKISIKAIYTKLGIMDKSLRMDFALEKPKIAVLGLNPHAGDKGAIGKEDDEIIRPAIDKARENDILAFGPYPADGFFGAGQFRFFDGVLAMYHDQGLAPFKALVFGEGVNYTAGLPRIRTSPDHGPAFDIAGKNKADNRSFVHAIFTAIEMFRNRTRFEEAHANPIQRHQLQRER